MSVDKLSCFHPPQNAGPIYRFVQALRLASHGLSSESTRTECDSHADTCVAGCNTVKLSDDGRAVTVHGFTDDSQPHPNIPIATVATVWIGPEGAPYLLIIHEALFFGDLVHGSLLNPNQLRANHVKVHDTPRQFEPSSTHSIHAVTEDGDAVTIPLTLRGIMSGFESTKPTAEDLH